MALPTAAESQALLGHAREQGWWFRAKEDIVRDFVRPYLRPRSAVLILGAGEGGTVERVREIAPDCSITGLDIDSAAVALCQARDPRGAYRQADLDADALGGAGSADVVFALDILEHLEHHDRVVGRAAACLRPGGVFVINVPAHPWLFSLHDRHLGHLRRYRPAEIEALARAQGLEVARSTPLFATTLLLLVLWRRLVQPALALRETASDVGMRLPWLVDRVLYGIARLEGWAARARLPFGSSHLLIARKP
jgi:2-polyprenyl-3-methyl-5-hydroxy-6-metoxy-1,4-benzoquinol methylase